MKRNSFFCVAALAAAIFVAPAPAVAQSAEEIAEAEQRRYQALMLAASAKQNQAEAARAQAAQYRAQAASSKDPDEAARLNQLATQEDARADQLTQEANQLYSDAINQAKQSEAERQAAEAEKKGLAQHADNLAHQMEMEEARAEAENENLKEMYDKPGFWDKLGDKLIDIGGDLLSQLIQQWIAGGGEDDELLAQIEALQAERDRLEEEKEELANAANEGGMGQIIVDPDGKYGYDRDGDGWVDFPLDPSTGEPIGSNSATDDSGYNTDSGDDYSSGYDSGDGMDGLDGLDGLDNSTPYMGGGGGASAGNGMGNFASGPWSAGGGSGDGGIGGEDGGAPLAANGAGGLDGMAGANDDGGEDGMFGKSASEDGDDEADERETENIIGRVVILPKVEEEVADFKKGNFEEGGEWSDDFEEWGDDDWDDNTDNGDEAFEEDWGEGSKVGDGEKSAKLIDEIIHVETVIQEWRKAEEEKDEFSDPYFQDDGMQGNHAGGEEEDPFKDFRDEDGKIDVKKVNIWVVDRDSWKEGEEPIRYKVEVPDDLKDFDPIHGGVLVVRGVVDELEVKKSVMSTIKGEVKTLEIVSVILSAPKPPEDMDSLDPSKTTDEEVGGATFDEDW